MSTVTELAKLAHVHDPLSPSSPGAKWLADTAAHVPEITELADRTGVAVDQLVTEHAHLCVEDWHHNPVRVCADLHVEPLSHRRVNGGVFGAQWSLFQVARHLLVELTRTNKPQRG